MKVLDMHGEEFYADLEEDVENLKERVEDLQNSVAKHDLITRGRLHLKQGESKLQSVMQDAEDLDLESVRLAIDDYRQCVILVRENDIELEAMAYAYLANVYGKVLLLHERADELGKTCMTLAAALMPRNLETESWFVECKALVAKYRQEKEQSEQQKHMAEIQPYLDELKDELEKMKAESEMSAESFLEFLYKTHPPAKEEHRVKLVYKGQQPDAVKKDLQKVIIHYHPDKNLNPKKYHGVVRRNNQVPHYQVRGFQGLNVE
jgi:hypothetical protein